MTIDLNCDLGEGMSNDAAIMPYISSANIACGYHAGDDATIRKTIELCLQHNVAIGAHPGFHDKPNFGRTSMHLSSEELYDSVQKQLEIVRGFCDEMGATLHHVKPHGAMYTMAAKDRLLSAVLAKAVKEFNPNLFYYGLSGSCMIDEAERIELMAVNEVFADRTYQSDGSLTSRSQGNAMIEDTETAIGQVLEMLENKSVTATNGTHISIIAESICIHGDGKSAVSFAQLIHSTLQQRGIIIQTPLKK